MLLFDIVIYFHNMLIYTKTIFGILLVIWELYVLIKKYEIYVKHNLYLCLLLVFEKLLLQVHREVKLLLKESNEINIYDLNGRLVGVDLCIIFDLDL